MKKLILKRSRSRKLTRGSSRSQTTVSLIDADDDEELVMEEFKSQQHQQQPNDANAVVEQANGTLVKAKAAEATELESNNNQAPIEAREAEAKARIAYDRALVEASGVAAEEDKSCGTANEAQLAHDQVLEATRAKLKRMEANLTNESKKNLALDEKVLKLKQEIEAATKEKKAQQQSAEKETQQRANEHKITFLETELDTTRELVSSKEKAIEEIREKLSQHYVVQGQQQKHFKDARMKTKLLAKAESQNAKLQNELRDTKAKMSTQVKKYKAWSQEQEAVAAEQIQTLQSQVDNLARQLEDATINNLLGSLAEQLLGKEEEDNERESEAEAKRIAADNNRNEEEAERIAAERDEQGEKLKNEILTQIEQLKNLEAKLNSEKKKNRNVVRKMKLKEMEHDDQNETLMELVASLKAESQKNVDLENRIEHLLRVQKEIVEIADARDDDFCSPLFCGASIFTECNNNDIIAGDDDRTRDESTIVDEYDTFESTTSSVSYSKYSKNLS